ncbi:MAG: carboxypeptidase regulatory-like domain-containing protein [Muribaculaceae bacterium]
MRVKLFLLLSLLVALPALSQSTGVRGLVVDAKTGLPVVGATVMLDEQGISVTSGPNGDFSISDAVAGNDRLLVLSYGYKDWMQDVIISANVVENVGTIKLMGIANSMNEADDFIVSESQIEDEEGNSQSIATLSGANDNIFYQAASYDFSLMRFRVRGYDSEYTQTMINGIVFNDPARGRFNYSMMGGMNQAFKNKSIGMGLEATSYGFGDVGGANNIVTFAKDYAPGTRASVAYTNSNYYLRGMLTHATGLRKNGWALTVSAVARYSDEGIVPGSFYNSWGYFISAQKVFNPQHSLSITTFGAPTKRAANTATFQEAYDLTGDNLYNPSWGWQEGEKRNAKVVESFDPTAIVNWIWTPKAGVTLNTGVAVRKSFYSSSALNWYNAADPRPDYYRYLPSYFDDEDTKALYTEKWRTDDTFRQIDWAGLYQTNYLNNLQADETGVPKGATYIIEKRHSNQLNTMFNSVLNARLNDFMTLQAGVGANWSRSSYYKTIKDLLGGRYWTDTDQFSERDYPNDKHMLQNDMNHPNRKVQVDDRFGYDYDVNSFSANAWIQNMINLPRWDINYGLTISYTQFQRDGHMRNGRAPENSYGKGVRHEFDNAGVKAGATYKIDGRNNITAHAYYGTKAPLFDQAYVSPRIKDDAITGLASERILSGDLSYNFNYRRFMGSITGFWTNMYNQTERTSFYDDQFSTFMNYVLTGVKKTYKGVEVGLAYRITPSITLSGAATFSRYQYKNRPTGTRSYENGQAPDTTQVVYLKNFYVGGTPQQAYSLTLKWSAPKMWFLEVNGVYMADSYVDLSPIRHEAMPNLYKVCETEEELQAKVAEITRQERLKDNFVLNLSIGKLIYLNRTASLNINLNLDNVLNNRNIQTSGYQQGRFDYTNYTTTKYPNKYYYAQGFRAYVNVGVKF